KAPAWLRKITIKAKLGFLIVMMAIGMIQVGLLGLNGMRNVENGLQSVYSDQLLPSQQIGTINDLMRADIEALYKMALRDPRLHGGEADRSEEHTSELHAREKLVCRLLIEKKNRIARSY